MDVKLRNAYFLFSSPWQTLSIKLMIVKETAKTGTRQVAQ